MTAPEIIHTLRLLRAIAFIESNNRHFDPAVHELADFTAATTTALLLSLIEAPDYPLTPAELAEGILLGASTYRQVRVLNAQPTPDDVSGLTTEGTDQP